MLLSVLFCRLWRSVSVDNLPPWDCYQREREKEGSSKKKRDGVSLRKNRAKDRRTKKRETDREQRIRAVEAVIIAGDVLT